MLHEIDSRPSRSFQNKNTIFIYNFDEKLPQIYSEISSEISSKISSEISSKISSNLSSEISSNLFHIIISSEITFKII